MVKLNDQTAASTAIFPVTNMQYVRENNPRHRRTVNINHNHVCDYDAPEQLQKFRIHIHDRKKVDRCHCQVEYMFQARLGRGYTNEQASKRI